MRLGGEGGGGWGGLYKKKYVNVMVRRSVGKRKDAGSTPLFGSSISSKVVIYGHCLVTLPCTTNATVKWLTSMPILMRKSF